MRTVRGDGSKNPNLLRAHYVNEPLVIFSEDFFRLKPKFTEHFAQFRKKFRFYIEKEKHNKIIIQIYNQIIQYNINCKTKSRKEKFIQATIFIRPP